MNGTSPFYQLIQHPWVSAPQAGTGSSARASVTAAASSGQQIPEVKRGAAMACGTGKAYLIGGQAAAGQSSSGLPRACTSAYEFSFASRLWAPLPQLPSPLTQAQAVATTDDFVFVVGGWCGDSYSADTWLLAPHEHPSLQPPRDEEASDPQAANAPRDAAAKPEKKARNAGKEAGEGKLCWRRLQPPVDVHGRVQPSPSPRVGHALVKGVVPVPACDGQSAQNSLTTSSAVGQNDHGDTRQYDTVIYLFGGFDGEHWCNDVWCLHVEQSLQRREAVWEQIAANGRGAMSGPEPRSDASMAFDPVLQRLYVCFGQTHAGLVNDCWELNLSTYAWRALTTSGTVSPRCRSVAVVPDGVHLYVLAGEGEAHQCIPQLLRLSLLDYKWHLLAPVKAEAMLSGRAGFVGAGGTAGERGCVLFGGVGSGSSVVELALDPAHVVETSSKRK